MPGAKRSSSGSDGEPTAETQALIETLRAVAAQIGADPALGAQIMHSATVKAEPGGAPRPAREVVAPPLDPFAVLRQSGEQGLRKALAALDLAALKAILRAYRLDPARIAARWTAPERIVELIVEQAAARLNQGRAFERV
jgi:hypothetical protein